MPDRAGRLSGSKSLNPSQGLYSSGPSNSRPFLNMLNPMGRSHHGYIQANQAVLEEEDDEEEREGNDSGGSQPDLEVGRSRSTMVQSTAGLVKSKDHKQVSWDEGASEMNALRSNDGAKDKMHEREDSDDDEVPQSFMIETSHKSGASKGKQRDDGTARSGSRKPLHSVSRRKVSTEKHGPGLPMPVSIPLRPSEVDDSDRTPRSSNFEPKSTATQSFNTRRTAFSGGLNEEQKAMWNWHNNIYNLDAFLQEIYNYYEGKGIYSIALSKGLNLLTVGFVIAFSTFLLGCIDYSKFRHGQPTKLSDVVIDHCVSRFSGVTLMFFLLFLSFYIWQIVQYILQVINLVDMYNFYTHLLKIPDADIQTISWPEVVRRIRALRDDNPNTTRSSGRGGSDDINKAKLDAHDIANRIMRQENYLIALFNKEVLDLRVPLPQSLKRFAGEEGKGTVLTQALEWNLRFCLKQDVFDHRGKLKKAFLSSQNRHELTRKLRRRFIFMGILNAIFAPFIVLYLIMYSFFRYFEEYHKDPSSIGGRRYTSYARWKFREFNELNHLFARRLDESYPLSSMYIGQFPNAKITIIMRFVAFIAGSFAAVLLLATVIEPDIFFNFEISPHRTVVFYLGVFTAVLTSARGMIPEDNRVFDPELLMTEVINYTHYMPDEWKGQLHSKQVHQEFGELFAMKVLIFGQELLSVVLTPFVLWFSLPDCAPAIIDFFREFSVHVEGRGYVCSFAEFNFERHGNVKFGAPTQTRDEKMVSNEGKMEKSFLNFKAANPDWNPSDPSGSLYLRRMADLNAAQHRMHAFGRRGRAAGQEGESGAGAVHFAEDPRKPAEKTLTERAQEYDRALRQSQLVAATRRRGVGMTGSVLMGASMIGDHVGAGGPSASSIFGGFSMAQTAVLGDSQGSVQINDGVARSASGSGSGVLSEDAELDSLVVGSGLGGGYIDGAKRPPADGEEEDEDMHDAGVLGLLAQIYGRKDGGPVL